MGKSIAVVACLMGVTICANASITVNPVTPYSFDSTTLYYALSSQSNVVDENAGFVRVAVNAAATATSNGLVQLDISTSLTPAAGEELVVTLFAVGDVSTNYYSIPIDYAVEYSGTNVNLSLVACGTGGSVCDADRMDSGYYVSANPSSGKSLRVGFYPYKICEKEIGGNPAGCDAANDLVTTETLQIYATVVSRATGNVAAIIKGDESSDNFKAFSLKFSTDGPTAVCAKDFNTLYFPGDKEIEFFANSFALTTDYTLSSQSVPLAGVMVVGKEGADPDTGDNATLVSNPIVGRISIGFSGKVSGFTNSTPDNPNVFHHVWYVFYDAAGVMSDISSAFLDGSGCESQTVRSADIAGFLSKGNCFIATAAYQDPDALPVQMLRQFRDHVLNRFSIGRSFISWYYKNSPMWAERLWSEPGARYVILKILTPIELIAWLILHPLYWLGGSLGLLALFMSRRLRLG